MSEARNSGDGIIVIWSLSSNRFGALAGAIPAVSGPIRAT